MKINGQIMRSIWFDEADRKVKAIDQTRLPHRVEVIEIDSVDAACDAITSMKVRGAPLIGITAAVGMYLALREHAADAARIADAHSRLLGTRPTAVNLSWALSSVSAGIKGVDAGLQAAAALEVTRNLMAEDAAGCSAIGDFGLEILEQVWLEKGGDKHGRVNSQGSQDLYENSVARLNILTHCNAGWLATADWGTALAPIYKAHQKGLPVHVWVDETRPRNQGASLTAWELQQAGIPHTIITDNAGGHLMQLGEVDVCLVGSDRTTANGDVCNKIGTYLKALAAFDNAIPFYVAVPVSTVDFSLNDGLTEIPIEQRDGAEVTTIQGADSAGQIKSVRITPEGSPVANFGFDVTPARLVSALITEKGVLPASTQGMQMLQQMVGRD